MLKNNLRLELETIHHDPRRQAGGMTKDSSANRPPRPNMERPHCLICQVHSRESENAQRSALFAAIYFSSKMRYYIFEKCNWSKLAGRIGRNKWNFLWNAYLGHVWQIFRASDCFVCWPEHFHCTVLGWLVRSLLEEGECLIRVMTFLLGDRFRTIAPLPPLNEVSVLR